jgi:hypothetical protein
MTLAPYAPIFALSALALITALKSICKLRTL